MQDDSRVAIVGGGPVGLATALTLSRHGVPCVIYESNRTIAKEQRGAAIHPPTMEILSKLGLEAELMSKGIRVSIWQMRDRIDGVYAEFDLGVLADVTPFPYRYHLPQHYVSNMLLDALRARSNVEIRLGETVESAWTDGNVARLTVSTANGLQHVEVPWLVGADGAHSKVRQSAVFSFDGFTWPEKFLVTNVPYPMERLGFPGTAYVSDPDAWAVVLKLYDETYESMWRITMPADPDVADEVLLNPENVRARLHEVFGSDVDLPIAHSNTYRVHQRVADTFVKGRIALAGDAAHLNNPIGGFGLNGGIHDAFTLGSRLADIWHHSSGHEVVDLYSRQRRTVALEVVQKNSIRNKKAMEERDPAVRRKAQAAMRALSHDPVKAREFLLESSMISSIRRAEEVT